MSPVTVVLASRNKHKVAELQKLLSGYLGDSILLKSLDDVGILGEIEETGKTFAENALIKAKAAAASGYIGLGDDSGLSVNALDGAPGIYSARYAGDHGNDAANNALLLHNLENEKDRSAAFLCTLCCVFPGGGKPLTVVGKAEGEILKAPRGENGFGYDPLFYYPTLGKTMAEMSGEEKNQISHRGDAVRRFAELFAAWLQSEERNAHK